MEAQSFHGDPFQGPEIQLAGSQDGERLDLETMAVRGEKRFGRPAAAAFCQDLWNPLFRQGVQDGQLFAPAFIRDAGDGTDLQPSPDANCRASSTRRWGTISPDLGESRQPIRDGQKSIVVQCGDVTGNIPSVPDRLGG